MINSWQALEEFAYDLISPDNPRKPAGSGSAKKEEDVISNCFIVQCKYTEDKNMSILNKDLTRLLLACELQDKIPLFITSNRSDIVLSIPIKDSTRPIINTLLELAVIMKRSEKISDDIRLVKTIGQFEKLQKSANRINILIYGIKNKFESLMRKTAVKLAAKYDDLTICDLFEGEKDGTQ